MPYNFDTIVERRTSDSAKWNFYPPDVIPLWVADMDFATPEPIRNALHTAIDRGVLGYEFLTQRTRQVVAARMAKLYNWQVDPDWVVATTGVVSGFNIAARTVCTNPTDGMLIQTPVYHMFYTLYKYLGLTQQTSPILLPSEGRFLTPTLDLPTFATAFHSNNARTRMFLLCHPHNPTGQTFTRNELQAMADLCLQNDTIIVSDEIHSELLLTDEPHIPIASLSPEIADKTITLIAPSKTFNTAGLFCSFAIIPNADLRERYKLVNDQITGHPTSLGLIAAETAFSGVCDDWLSDLRTYLKANRDFVCDYLTENFPQAKFTVPTATYLQWIDFTAYVESGRITPSPYQFFLDQAKVAVNDGKVFGAGYENFIRLNFASPRSMLAEGLDRMRQAVERVGVS